MYHANCIYKTQEVINAWCPFIAVWDSIDPTYQTCKFLYVMWG